MLERHFKGELDYYEFEWQMQHKNGEWVWVLDKGRVAHDFNNMLGVILGHAELVLEQTEGNPDIYSDLKEIQKAAQRSADLTRQLLTFARKQIITPRKLDLNLTVKSMLTMLRRLIGEDIDLAGVPPLKFTCPA